uniref:Uncharacterized protein n=1 Tax=Siphoviridae sp. ctGsX68 TaxID=2825417 RepID=A0A8S5UU93_9CAUD|nr:MAG TPA: hypothetical protein [Siphoviridae sp. ctGsX68]DAU23188.1 MAG TPA: hypothetical protein [Caudoviricetes sp.]
MRSDAICCGYPTRKTRLRGLAIHASVQNGVFMYRGKKHYILAIFFAEMY